MQVTAELNYLRMAPRKARLVANAIRGKRVPDAERTLRFLTRRAAGPFLKLLRGTVQNAKVNFQIQEPASLVVRDVQVDGGPMLKRIRPRAMGRAFRIRKRTSHIRLILETTEVIRRKPKRGKADIAVVREPDAGASVEETAKGAHERSAFRDQAKTRTKSADFVRRVFRRKAI